jgi:hypothetical protein
VFWRLHQWTQNLNQFIGLSQDRLRRYQNVLGNLAHSPKTPMAVMRSELGGTRAEINITSISES